MSATHVSHPTPPTLPTLYLAFDLGWTSWNLAFSTGMAQKPRLRTIPARDLEGLQREIQRARQRFGLPDDAPVVSCYEAGRDGFWLHRYLIQRGVENRAGGTGKHFWVPLGRLRPVLRRRTSGPAQRPSPPPVPQTTSPRIPLLPLRVSARDRFLPTPYDNFPVSPRCY